MKYGYIRTVPSDKTNSLEMQVEILQTVPGILFFIDKCGIDGNKKNSIDYSPNYDMVMKFTLLSSVELLKTLSV